MIDRDARDELDDVDQNRDGSHRDHRDGDHRDNDRDGGDRHGGDYLETGEAEATMAFLLRLRARGIADVTVLRALERVPRLAFVPHRYADLALRDMALPIPCGQTMSEPFVLARTLEALEAQPSHRILEIGTGSGYGTALLARLGGEIVSYERFQTLALEASVKLRGLGVANVKAYWADGLDVDDDMGLFDRILVDGLAPAELIPKLVDRLAQGGVLVAAVAIGLERQLVKIVHRDGSFAQTSIAPCRVAGLIPGVSRAL